MKIAVLGASGNVGAEIVKELSRRDHQVTAIARNSEAVVQAPNVTPLSGDASDPAALAKLISGHDAVISALHHTIPAQTLIQALKQAGVSRFLVTGGAGSLQTPNGRLMDQPHFPAEFRGFAEKGVQYLADLKGVDELNWTFFSPAAFIFDGPRTGEFRLGTDQLLFNKQGESKISFADFAIAMVDELENPRHTNAQMTIAY